MQLDRHWGEDDVQLLADDVLNLGTQLREVSVQVAQQHLLPAVAGHLQLCEEFAGLRMQADGVCNVLCPCKRRRVAQAR